MEYFIDYLFMIRECMYNDDAFVEEVSGGGQFLESPDMLFANITLMIRELLNLVNPGCVLVSES